MNLLQRFLLDEYATVHFRRTPTIYMSRFGSLTVAEIARHHRIKLVLLEVPRDGDDDLLWIVVRINIRHQILTAKASNRLFTTQDRSAERVTSQDLTSVEFLDEILWIILNHTNLFQHDLLFLLDLLRIEA